MRFSLVTQSCPTLWPYGLQHARLPFHHQLQELAQTHVHQVSDAIQPSHPLSSPSPPAFNLSQYQKFSIVSVLCIRWPKFKFFIRWSIQADAGASVSPSVLPVNIQGRFLGLISLISLQSKGISRLFSNITVQKHQFIGIQSSLSTNSHIHIWLLENRRFDWMDLCW